MRFFSLVEENLVTLCSNDFGYVNEVLEFDRKKKR